MDKRPAKNIIIYFSHDAGRYRLVVGYNFFEHLEHDALGEAIWVPSKRQDIDTRVVLALGLKQTYSNLPPFTREEGVTRFYPDGVVAKNGNIEIEVQL